MLNIVISQKFGVWLVKMMTCWSSSENLVFSGMQMIIIKSLAYSACSEGGFPGTRMA